MFNFGSLAGLGQALSPFMNQQQQPSPQPGGMVGGGFGSPLLGGINPGLMQHLAQLRQAQQGQTTPGNVQPQPSPMAKPFQPSPLLPNPIMRGGFGATPSRPNMVAPPRRRGFGGI